MDLINNHNFLTDACRFSEGLLTQDQVIKKYRLSDADLKLLENDEPLIAAIEAEKTKRIRCGDTARERAQVLYAEVPNRLGDFLRDPTVSPRHAIESAKEIRAIAANAGDIISPAAAAERFTIVINMGNDPGDTLTYSVPNNTNKLENSKLIEHDERGDNGNEFL